MNVLITGARAPVAIDLARFFSQSDVGVYMADSFCFPIARFSKYVKGYHRIPAPVLDPQGFVRELCKAIKKYKIDLLLPTCEEIFFIGYYKAKFPCSVFCDNFQKLQTLHNKYLFTKEALECGIKIPTTKLIADKKSLLSCETNDYVFKPVYSRFASQTYIRPGKKTLAKLKINAEYPWVQQDYIAGKEYCSYSIAVKGKLKAHSCYHPLYRFGKGSGIYFPATQNAIIFNFVKKFVEKMKFHGQIGFDFIAKNEGNSREIYVLECNPRATSGIHLLNKSKLFVQAFEENNDTFIDAKGQIKTIKIAMLLCGWQQESFKKFYFDLKNAQGILSDKDDPIPFKALLINLTEVIARSVYLFKSIQQASTYDIEWNGQPL